MRQRSMPRSLAAALFALGALFLGSGLSFGVDAQDATSMSVAEFDVLMEDVSNRGRWGPEDELGTLNLVTDEVRRRAMAEARAGVTVSMSLPVESGEGMNTRVPMERDFVVTPPGAMQAWALDGFTLDYHGWSFSHLDGLSHAIYRGRLYNGFGREVLEEGRAERLGIQNLADGIVSRGVLVDVPRLRGVEWLEPGSFVTVEDLEAFERETGVRVRSGDVLLIRTGRWAREASEGPWPLTESAAGPHPTVARWLHDRDVAVLGGDNTNERYPEVVEGVSPVHVLSLVSMGMPLLDNLDLESVAREAAARSRPTFLFIGAPLPIPGGTGSPLNPLAIF